MKQSFNTSQTSPYLSKYFFPYCYTYVPIDSCSTYSVFYVKLKVYFPQAFLGFPTNSHTKMRRKGLAEGGGKIRVLGTYYLLLWITNNQTFSKFDERSKFTGSSCSVDSNKANHTSESDSEVRSPSQKQKPNIKSKSEKLQEKKWQHFIQKNNNSIVGWLLVRNYKGQERVEHF